MSRYLKNLVMRSLGELSGLRPRPAARHEFVRQNAVVEFMESTQEQPFRDRSSWTSPTETDTSPAEGDIERGRQTDARLPSESGRESIRKRRQNQPGIFDEKSGEGEVTRRTQANPVRSTYNVSREEAAKRVSSVPRSDTAVSDRRETSTAPLAPRSEVLPVMRSRQAQPATPKDHPPSVRHQDVLSDSLRPTLNEVSFQPVHGEMIAPPTEVQAPIVQIRIGRIEVRAVEPPVPAPNKKLVEPPRSSVSLDQYLRRRSQEA